MNIDCYDTTGTGVVWVAAFIRLGEKIKYFAYIDTFYKFVLNLNQSIIFLQYKGTLKCTFYLGSTLLNKDGELTLIYSGEIQSLRSFYL